MTPLDLLAHQGGLDEIALVGGPMLVFGLLLWLAKRRAMALLEQAEKPPPDRS